MLRDEFDFIDAVRQRALKERGGGLLTGIGDDAAIFRNRADRDIVITADLLVEDIDFRRAYTPPCLLGHKALAVSLSDIAAMGARPRFCLLSIGIPREVWRTKFLDHFYEGFFALADAHDVTLIGGDTSRTPERIIVDSIVIGEARRNRSVLRSGARAGDAIYVTGALGGAAAGLRLLEGGARIARTPKRTRTKLNTPQSLMLRQLAPEPRTTWGEFLGSASLASAMIDISDGLSSDLAHLCRASSVGAKIDAARIPIDLFVEESKITKDEAFKLALHGGEDYELLFTVRPRRIRQLPYEIGGVPVTRIGEITSEAGSIEIVQESRARILKPTGFTHFGRPK